MMKTYGRCFFSACLLLFGALSFGCGGVGQYAQVRVQAAGPDAVSIAGLRDHWTDYDVYYAGYHGKESTVYPAGLLFDPRDDVKTMTGERWTRVADLDTLETLIARIEDGRSSQGYYPRIWQVTGPEGTLYGYLFASRAHVVAKMVDENTLYIYDIPQPPSLEDVLKAPGSGPM